MSVFVLKRKLSTTSLVFAHSESKTTIAAFGSGNKRHLELRFEQQLPGNIPIGMQTTGDTCLDSPDLSSWGSCAFRLFYEYISSFAVATMARAINAN